MPRSTQSPAYHRFKIAHFQAKHDGTESVVMRAIYQRSIDFHTEHLAKALEPPPPAPIARQVKLKPYVAPPVPKPWVPVPRPIRVSKRKPKTPDGMGERPMRVSVPRTPESRAASARKGWAKKGVFRQRTVKEANDAAYAWMKANLHAEGADGDKARMMHQKRLDAAARQREKAKRLKDLAKQQA